LITNKFWPTAAGRCWFRIVPGMAKVLIPAGQTMLILMAR
jgi:hypothetical protein